MVELFSHNILQKSSVVSANGPCVAIYAFCCLQERESQLNAAEMCSNWQNQWLPVASSPKDAVGVPVSIDEAGVDIVGPFQPSDWLKAHSSGLIRHDVDQAVFKFVAWQIGTYESGRVGFGVR